MNDKGLKTLFLILIIGFIDINPDYIGGVTSVRTLRIPENSRIVNSICSGDNYSYLDRSINNFIRKWELQGASVAIAKDGKLVFARGYGSPDSKNIINVEPYHRFRVASISKLITATAIMKLYEEGKLSLDDKVFGPNGILNYAYFEDPRDKRVHTITIEHLLSHQCGWTTRWGDHMFMPHVVAASLGKETPVTTEDIVRFALNKRLHFTPGSGRSYSNLGYAVLGLVVSEVSGMPYDQYCRKELFEPLGLFDFVLAKNLYEQKDPLEVMYFEPSNAIPLRSVYDSRDFVAASNGGNDVEALGGAGAWVGTAPDLLRFMLSIDGFDSPEDILSPESIRYMTSHGNGVAPVGWKGTTQNGYWWRTGSFAGTSAMMRRQPDGTAWVVLFNTNTWKQSMFPSDISKMMSRAISGTRDWIGEDLFKFSLPVPIEPSLPIR
ncbi:MAG TPA: serine hydrolase domain-containing protein [Bacteroidales bacterium]|nr:serine hydrolase domain-containing protein [Bacteroidales bacterium]